MAIFSDLPSPSLDDNPDTTPGTIPDMPAVQGDSVVNWIQGELKDWLHERERMRRVVPLADDEHSKSVEASNAPTDNYPMHERFCFPAENIYFLVNGVLYSVHRYFFERDSSSFAGQGLSKREPMVLADISTRDLDLFLSILYPLSFGLYSVSTVDEWSSILHLADKWSFESVRALAITQLAPIASPIDKIVLGRRYGVNEWLSGAYGAVCVQPAALTLDEGRRLGVDDVIRIYAIRQEFCFILAPRSSLTEEQVDSHFGLTVQTPPSAPAESRSEDNVLPDYQDEEATDSEVVGPAATGASYSRGESPAPPIEQPAGNASEGFALASEAARKGKIATSKAASKAMTSAAVAPRTPVERIRSTNWASASAPTPETVIDSPDVGAEPSSFKDTFQLQDFAAKDKAKDIAPSFDMSTPVLQTEQSPFGAPSPPAENSSSWGSKIGGFGDALKSFGFGKSGGSATPAAAPEKASGDWGIGSFDNKDSTTGAGAGDAGGGEDCFSPSGIEATSPGQHNLSSAFGLRLNSLEFEAAPEPPAPEPVIPVVEAPPAGELGPNGKPLSKIMLRKRQKEREAKEKAYQDARERDEADRAYEAERAAEEERVAEEQRMASTFDPEYVPGGWGSTEAAVEPPPAQEEEESYGFLTPKERKKKEEEREKAQKERADQEIEEQVAQQMADEARAADEAAAQQGTANEVPGGWGSGGGWGGTGGAERAVNFDPLNDPAWDNLAPKDKKKKQKEAEERIEREKRETELADFMNEQDAELNPTGGGNAGGAGVDMADLMGASEPAPPPFPEKAKEEEEEWGGGAPKKGKKGGKKKKCSSPNPA